ncbi:hypothetical protein LTR49_028360 [Elasticomyces elasticus]|nr:hypothetical protein LTR49_028360 [Elasticomyces elasticus]
MTSRTPSCDEMHEQSILEAAEDGDTIFVLASETRIRVSSTLLSYASPVFAAMLKGSFAEGRMSKTVDSPAEIRLEDGDDEAFVLLCKLLHFRHDGDSTLRNMTPAALTERVVRLAKIADKYDCIDAFELIGEGLLSRCARCAEDTLPFVSMANLAAAAYLLQQKWYFALFTRRLVLQYNEPFSVLSGAQYANSLPSLTLLYAAEQRHRLCANISETIADHATKVCVTGGCNQSATSLEFAQAIAKKLAPPIQNWPPKFASVHRLNSVLASLSATTQRWMFVVDNADQLDWGVQRIVPAGEAGSVIATSQDGHASQLLGRRSELVMVEEMNPEEACSLLLKAVDEDGSSASEELPALSTRIVDTLDRLALAIDLAAARIGSNVDRGDEVRVAMHRYLTDFQRHQDKLLQSKEFNEASHYDQTVWTVWEASLASLRSIEDRESLIQPVAFLTLLTFLDRANIRTELFRLASGGVLAQGEDKQWDDFYYRETIKPLIRFGLVRWTQDTWPGFTMHGFVRWRAAKEREETACWQWYTTFCTAACMQKAVEVATAEFRRHMLVHLPPIGRLLKDGGQSGECDLCSMWTHVGRVWEDEGRWNESEKLFFAARTWRMEKLGEEHVDTLSAMANLASTYWKQGRWKARRQGRTGGARRSRAGCARG